jgi:hypothetical protein
VVGSIALPSFPHYYLQTLTARVEVFLPTSSEHHNTFSLCVSFIAVLSQIPIFHCNKWIYVRKTLTVKYGS